MTAPADTPLTREEIAELRRLHEEAWPAPWVARTFEIDCPCPNGEHCGNDHTCEEVEAPEAYPASPEDPAAEGDGQCVVQISVPGLESLAGPCAAFIAAIRNAAPRLLLAAERAEGLAEALERMMRVYGHGNYTAAERRRGLTTDEIGAEEQAWRALAAYRGERAMTFAFCETVTAGPTTPWHVRQVGESGLHPGGGADSPALCGRVVAWDLRVEITEHHLGHACKRCVEAYRGSAGGGTTP